MGMEGGTLGRTDGQSLRRGGPCHVGSRSEEGRQVQDLGSRHHFSKAHLGKRGYLKKWGCSR